MKRGVKSIVSEAFAEYFEVFVVITSGAVQIGAPPAICVPPPPPPPSGPPARHTDNGIGNDGAMALLAARPALQ